MENKQIKTIHAVVVGYGNRGGVYADYSLQNPTELKIVGIVDPNPFKLEQAKSRYNLTDKQVFKTWEDFLAAHIETDIVINATMDELHYETGMAILKAGYNMLIEKPIVNSKDELLALKNEAEKHNSLVFVCHVLRYTPFYRRIKQMVNDGRIGEIMSMEMNEHVWVPHFLTSYDRGKWNSEEACGSGFILAKCCHDMDLVAWINNASKPKKVVSFGSRRQFVPSKKPKDATEFCYNCPHEKSCIYSAINHYYESDTMPFLVWDRLNKPLDQITKEEKLEFLKHDIYGRCAYDTGGDIVDRQNLLIEFENGSICSFTLVGGAAKADRYIHIVGNKGEIEGKLEENTITVRNYVGKCQYDEEVIDCSKEVINEVEFGGHSGGDHYIMHDLIRYLNGERDSISITSINDSVNGHLIVYAAEESRKENKIVAIE